MRSMLVLGVILSCGALGGAAGADDHGSDERGWKGRVLLTANGGYQTAAQDFAYGHAEDAVFARLSADATVAGSGTAAFDVGGAVRLVGNFGVGASYSRSSVDGVASLAINFTSPLLDGPLSDSLTGPARREESARPRGTPVHGGPEAPFLGAWDGRGP